MITIICLSFISVFIAGCWTCTMIQNERRYKELSKLTNEILKDYSESMDKHLLERQQLLDRIQSPSFAEYKHQEVRVIKAQSGEKEPPKLEVL